MKLVITLLLVLSATPAVQAQNDSWVGVYRFEGANPDGSTYRGAAQIVQMPNSNGLYQVGWWLDGEPGIGMVAFGFVWEDRLVVTNLRGAQPVVIKKNGDSRWAMWGQEGVGREKLTKTKFKTLLEAAKPGEARPVNPHEHGHEL